MTQQPAQPAPRRRVRVPVALSSVGLSKLCLLLALGLAVLAILSASGHLTFSSWEILVSGSLAAYFLALLVPA